MALPFLAGLAVGGLAIYAFNNKDKIQQKLNKGVEESKQILENAEEKVKQEINKMPRKKRKPRAKKVETNE